jgi:hypothetical protein
LFAGFAKILEQAVDEVLLLWSSISMRRRIPSAMPPCTSVSRNRQCVRLRAASMSATVTDRRQKISGVPTPSRIEMRQRYQNRERIRQDGSRRRHAPNRHGDESDQLVIRWHR